MDFKRDNYPKARSLVRRKLNKKMMVARFTQNACGSFKATAIAVQLEHSRGQKGLLQKMEGLSKQGQQKGKSTWAKEMQADNQGCKGGKYERKRI